MSKSIFTNVIKLSTLSKKIEYCFDVHHTENLMVAQTAQEALLLYRSFSPEIILLDIGLPDMKGLDLVKTIRKEDRQVYIIAQTAYAMHGDELLAVEAGCNDYISKPVNKNVLLKNY